jgi:hypothetical protein
MKFVCTIVALLSVLTASAVGAEPVKRHLVLYGGVKDTDIDQIARHADLLVLGRIRADQLRTVKGINPSIILLRYVHVLGIHPDDPDWEEVSRHDSWFVHDESSGGRMVARKYGWYLMNMAEPGWRRFLIRRFGTATHDMFDGIFIDDFWGRFIDKFTLAGSDRAAQPPQALVSAWEANMRSFLAMLRQNVNGRIFINGAHEAYLPLADGCMVEGFIHSNQRSDAALPDAVDSQRVLQRIKHLGRYDKTLLLQSGSNGDGAGALDRIYRLCFYGFLLVADAKIYFNFQPTTSYYFKGFYGSQDYGLDLGKPLKDYYLYKADSPAPNRVENPYFQKNLQAWDVISGSPAVELDAVLQTTVSRFEGRPDRRDQIRSGFIPVSGNTDYRVSVRCRAEDNRAGSARYKKFGLQGRFYDNRRRRLPGAFDLQFDSGTYDWQSFATTITSPAGAAFYRARLGFIGDGTGKGWVAEVYVGSEKQRAIVLRRDFEHGSVFVNYGRKTAEIDLGPEAAVFQSPLFNIDGHDAKTVHRQKRHGTTVYLKRSAAADSDP